MNFQASYAVQKYAYSDLSCARVLATCLCVDARAHQHTICRHRMCDATPISHAHLRIVYLAATTLAHDRAASEEVYSLIRRLCDCEFDPQNAALILHACVHLLTQRSKHIRAYHGSVPVALALLVCTFFDSEPYAHYFACFDEITTQDLERANIKNWARGRIMWWWLLDMLRKAQRQRNIRTNN